MTKLKEWIWISEIGWIIEYIKSMEKVKEYRKKEKKCLIRKFHEKCKRISWKN